MKATEPAWQTIGCGGSSVTRDGSTNPLSAVIPNAVGVGPGGSAHCDRNGCSEGDATRAGHARTHQTGPRGRARPRRLLSGPSRCPSGCGSRGGWRLGLAVDETVILLRPPLPLVGVSIVMERESVSRMTVSSTASWAELDRCVLREILASRRQGQVRGRRQVSRESMLGSNVGMVLGSVVHAFRSTCCVEKRGGGVRGGALTRAKTQRKQCLCRT